MAELRWRDRDAAARLQARVWLIERHGRLLRVEPELIAEAADIVADTALSAYDSAYVAAARRLDAVLSSCDHRDLVEPGFARLPGAVLRPRPVDGV